MVKSLNERSNKSLLKAEDRLYRQLHELEKEKLRREMAQRYKGKTHLSCENSLLKSS